MSYVPNQVTVFKRTAGYVVRILKGEKPAGLPVDQPTAFELIIDHPTAKSLGIALPATLLARADEVIDRCSFAAAHESGSGPIAPVPGDCKHVRFRS